MSESLLLQFCYQCDLGSIEDTFETLQKRVQWNFEAFLEVEKLQKKIGYHGRRWPQKNMLQNHPQIWMPAVTSGSMLIQTQNVNDWLLQNSMKYFIPILSPLGWSRQTKKWRGFGPNHMNLIQIIGNPASHEQPTMKTTKQSSENRISQPYRFLRPVKWKNLQNA